MARSEITEAVLVNAPGQLIVVAGASVQINVRGGGAATVYLDDTTGTTLTNPLTSDSAGRINGWLEAGAYDLVVTKPGMSSYTQPYFAAATGATGPAGVGANWRGVWSSGTTYALADGVYRTGVPYISNVGSNLNHDPATDTGTNWARISGEPAGWFNVKSLGAVGNNTNDDTAAVQAAIDAAHTAGGGVAFIPPGTYKMTGELTHRGGVHVQGVSARVSILRWNTDLGSGKFACKPSGDSNQGDAGSFSDLRLLGKGTGFASLGVQDCNMDGIYPDQNVHMTRVTVSNFRANLWIGQDHNVFDHCQFANGYYNVLYASGRASKGNHTYLNCLMDGAGFACVACEGNNTLDFVTFIGGQVGTAPYGFFKFDGPLGASTDAFLSSTELLNLAFENLGNAAIWDESTGTGSGADSMVGVRIENPGFVANYDAAHKIAGRSKDYIINVRAVSDVRIVQGTQGFGRFTTPDVGVIKVVSGGVDIQGTPYTKMFAPTCAAGSTMSAGNSRATVWKAKGTISAGDIVEVSYEVASAVRRYSSQNLPFAGVALTGAADGEAVLVAESGDVQVNMAETVGAGFPLRPDPTTPYQASYARGYTFGDQVIATPAPVIGFLRSAASSGGTGTMFIQHAPDRNYIRPSAVTSLPTASSTYRGQMVRIEGGSGVADVLYICQHKADNTYAWQSVNVT